MKRLVTTALLVLLAVTGCGGDSSKTAVKVAASPSSSSDASSVPTGYPSSAASALAGLASGACLEIASQFSKASSAFSSTDKTRTPSETFGALAEAMSNAADKIDKKDISAAFATLSRIYKSLADGLKGVDYKPGSGVAPPPAYLAAIRSFGAPEFAAASKTVGAYFTSGCK